MSELKDEVTEKIVPQHGYTLKECVDAYDAANLSYTSSNSYARADGLIVISAGEYYCHRFMHCAVDAFVIVMAIATFGLLMFAIGSILAAALSIFSARLAGFLCVSVLPIGLFVCTFCIKWLSSVKDYAGLGLRVVTKDGQPISIACGAIRSLAFCFTWFLLPVHLVLVAVGSRRFLHDLMTDTYVLIQGEEPDKTIYPPPPRWIAPVLVVACVAGVLFFADAQGWIRNVETSVVGTMLGVDSEFYMRYLHWRYDRLPVHFTYLAKEDAEKLLPHFVRLVELDTKYLGATAKESAGDIFRVAMLATQTYQPAVADKYLQQFLHLSPAATAEAFSVNHAYGYMDGKFPKLMAANLYRLNGRLDTATSLALSEKAYAFANQEADRFEQSSKLLILIYRTKVATGAKDADYGKLLTREESDLAKALK